MQIIYSPKGAAAEYASLACNLYNGCTHGCSYCYAPGCIRKSKTEYFTIPSPKKNAIERLKSDAKILAAKNDCPEILLSFIGDVYQPAEVNYQLTRQAIKILIEYNLPFTILTKGGRIAERDFDLLASYNKARFGVSLAWIYQDDANLYEPYAASIVDRILSLYMAKAMNIPTWVSLEPVIDPDQALLLMGLHSNIVDHWMIGKINHNAKLENKTDWPAFIQEAKKILNRRRVSYTFKQSLQVYDIETNLQRNQKRKGCSLDSLCSTDAQESSGLCKA